MREPRAPDHAPRDWSEAFAALPPEAPPADALSSVFARIPASTPTRTGRQWWIAAAAVLAIAAVVPFARHPGAGRDPVSLAVSSQPTTAVPLQNPASVVAPAMTTTAAPDQKTLDNQTQGLLKSDSRFRGNDGGKNSAPVRIAKADPPHRKPHRAHKASPTTDPSDKAMEPLYAESARLEALLALARDDRAASATAVALGSDFEARIAGIDATLMQPSLTSQRRLELWKDRVSALRAYASFESTQRALAASGERYDAMLVTID
jgi:hypothetical protein